MAMKEKLYKTNHKRSYYRIRQFLMVSFVIFSASIAVSVPTYIALNNKEAVVLKAEEVEQTELDSYSQEEVNNQ